MDTPITRAEHEEFCRRMEAENQRLADEDSRQNRRIDALETSFHELSALAASVEKLAVNMEAMLREQEKQGRRLETLEGRDGEMWRKVVGYLATAVTGAVIGFAFTQLGI